MKRCLRDVIDIIASEEDILFLVSMMGDRKASMVGADSVLSLTEKKVRLMNSSEMFKSWQLLLFFDISIDSYFEHFEWSMTSMRPS